MYLCSYVSFRRIFCRLQHSGEGPDVAMQMGEDIPVNYAMRNATADLSQFPDFEEISGRFRESGLTPYRYNDGVYALPEQQHFPMLFTAKIS